MPSSVRMAPVCVWNHIDSRARRSRVGTGLCCAPLPTSGSLFRLHTRAQFIPSPVGPKNVGETGDMALRIYHEKQVSLLCGAGLLCDELPRDWKLELLLFSCTSTQYVSMTLWRSFKSLRRRACAEYTPTGVILLSVENGTLTTSNQQELFPPSCRGHVFLFALSRRRFLSVEQRAQTFHLLPPLASGTLLR